MPIRITGMNSGLDTESIISELVKAKSVKKDNLVKAQTKLEWKQNAWKELNSKVCNFYRKTLSNMRFQSDYLKKTTKVSNSNAATVITGGNAVVGVQTLKIDKLATTGYLTGGELKKDGVKGSYTGSTKLNELGITENSQIRLTVDGKTTNIELNGNMTINDFVSKAKSAGVNASFDSKNQRFFISAKESGEAADFILSGKDSQGLDALNKLGLATANGYSALCNVEGGVYSAKNENQLKAVIDAEVSSRVSQYASFVKSYQDADGKIKEIGEKYKDNSLEEKTDLEQKLKEQEAALEAEGADKDAINDNIKNIKERIAAREELDKYTQQKEEAKNAITNANPDVALDAEPPVFTGKNYGTKADGTEGFEATAALRQSVTNEILAEAEFAAEVMNGTAQLNGQVMNVSGGATRIIGEDAKIFLNDAEFTSNVNTFEINGLTITANEVTDKEFTITTENDTDGIYDMVKNFFKEYNTLINEMDKLYNAESSKGYEPLTDEEKEAMSEKEIEKWEEKIKDSILRKDSTLSSVTDAMKSVMSMGVSVGGKQMYLSDFGINTLGYFTAADNEKGAYHIDGDPDDSSTSGNADKLKTAIANNPDMIVDFFTALSNKLYEKIGDMMKKTEYSSSFTLYDDVSMKEEYNDYKKKIAQQEQKITDFEDRYYKKFSAMETALAKMSSKESAISGLLGM